MNRPHVSLLLASLLAAPLAVAAPPETDEPTDDTPVMLITYVRLAINEEHETQARFGTAYEQYADAVPRFFPRRRRPLAVAS